MTDKPKKQEYLKNNLRNKKVFYYRDEKEGIDVLSREVYKGKMLEVHYPFDRNGNQKYQYIRSIEFHDISPKTINGIYKAVNFGLGFTRNLSPVIYGLESFKSIIKIIISPKIRSKMGGDTIVFNANDLEEVFNTIKPLKEIQSSELKRVTNNALADIYPKKIKHRAVAYKKGELGLFIKEKKISAKELSDSDIKRLIDVIPDSIKEDKVVYRAEEKINFIKLEKVRKEFKKVVNQKTDTKTYEGKCQKFFAKNSWIFSNVLSMPVVLLGGKAYVGGKGYDNKGGKEADFLFKNKLTDNVSIVEIKTPLKKIFDRNTPYRKPDIYSIGKEVSGGLIQVMSQKDKLQKGFYAISKGGYKSFNPKCVLIIGDLKRLREDQLESFELFRNNIKGCEIITYDELLERTNLILGQFISNGKKS